MKTRGQTGEYPFFVVQKWVFTRLTPNFPSCDIFLSAQQGASRPRKGNFPPGLH